jgi:hypothetical protein
LGRIGNREERKRKGKEFIIFHVSVMEMYYGNSIYKG